MAFDPLKDWNDNWLIGWRTRQRGWPEVGVRSWRAIACGVGLMLAPKLYGSAPLVLWVFFILFGATAIFVGLDFRSVMKDPPLTLTGWRGWQQHAHALLDTPFGYERNH